MFNRILVPVDLDMPVSWEKALPAAEQLAQDYAAELHVITVVPAYGMSIVGGFFPADFERKAIAKATTRLNEIVRENAKSADAIRTHIAHGTIYEEIVQAANRLKCDLIVMTSHRPELQDYLLGPNAARVARHAQQSVFLIRS